MFNPAILLKLQNGKEKFIRNHPKFPAFLRAVGKDAVVEGTIIDIQVTKPDGGVFKTNVRLQASDVEMLREVCNMDRDGSG